MPCLALCLPFVLLLSGSSFFLQTAAGQAAPVSSPVTPTAQPSLESARQSLAGGDPEKALQQLDKLAALQPEPAGVERLRGFVYYQQKQMSAAEAAYAKAVQQDPADRESMQMRGVALYSLGRPAEAIPLLEQAHAPVGAANVDPNYVLGVCYIAVRRYEDARKAFATQYGFAPDSAPAYLLAARLLLRQENGGTAEEFARKAVALQPTLPLAHQLLGEVALARARFAEAIAEFGRERDLNPLNGGVYDRLGDAYLRSGDDQKAQEALSRAVLLEPNASGPYILLGRVMLNQQNYTLAALYLERARSMDPGNSMTHNLLGQAYRRQGRVEQANKEFQAAEQIQNGGKGAAKVESIH